MEKIIQAAVERGASDLHIKAGDMFRARIDGKLVPLTKQRLTPEQTKQIALRLHISPKTVEAHRLRVMNKLEIDNVAQLTKYAIQEGLTTSEP